MPILLLPSIMIASMKGTIDYLEGRKVTDEAEKFHKEKMLELDESHRRMIKTLENLGKLEIEIYSEFDVFTGIFEKIHNKPVFRNQRNAGVNLPQFNLEDLKELSNKVKKTQPMDFASLAASGAKLYLLVPIPGIKLLLSGAFLLHKGHSSKKNAGSTLEKAREFGESIDELTRKMMDIRKYSNHYYMELYDTKRYYDRYLQRFIDSIEKGRKSDWSQFSEKEKLMAENVVLLVVLLNKMCKVELIKVKEESDDNQLNQVEVLNMIEESNGVIRGINESE